MKFSSILEWKEIVDYDEMGFILEFKDSVV